MIQMDLWFERLIFKCKQAVAYGLWEKDGKPENKSLYYWLLAEQMLRQMYLTSISHPDLDSDLNEFCIVGNNKKWQT